jgi:hypothetical protein
MVFGAGVVGIAGSGACQLITGTEDRHADPLLTGMGGRCFAMEARHVAQGSRTSR